MSNVTLLSSRGTLQEVMHILLWMLVKQLENLQYNVLRLVNVSDLVIESKHNKYKNDIHSDRNLFFFSVPEFQPSVVELSITNCMGNGERTYIFMQPKGLENYIINHNFCSTQGISMKFSRYLTKDMMHLSQQK